MPLPLPQTQKDELDDQNTPEVKQNSATSGTSRVLLSRPAPRSNP